MKARARDNNLTVNNHDRTRITFGKSIRRIRSHYENVIQNLLTSLREKDESEYSQLTPTLQYKIYEKCSVVYSQSSLTTSAHRNCGYANFRGGGNGLRRGKIF
jgi:hypothetical protein